MRLLIHLQMQLIPVAMLISSSTFHPFISSSTFPPSHKSIFVTVLDRYMCHRLHAAFNSHRPVFNLFQSNVAFYLEKVIAKEMIDLQKKWLVSIWNLQKKWLVSIWNATLGWNRLMKIYDPRISTIPHF